MAEEATVDVPLDLSEEPDNPLLHLMVTYGREYTPLFLLGIISTTIDQIPLKFLFLILGLAFDAIFMDTAAFTLPFVPQSWIPSTAMGQFWLTVGIVALIYPINAFMSWIASLAFGRLTQGMLHDVRTDTYDVMQHLELSYFDDRQTGEIMSIVNNDVDNLTGFVGQMQWLTHAISDICIAVLFMIYLSWQLTLVLLIVPVSLFALHYGYKRAVADKYDAMRESVGSLNARLQDNVAGISTIKSYTREDHERNRVRDASREYRDRNWVTIKLRMLLQGAASFVADSGAILAVAVGGYWVIVGPPLFFTAVITPGTVLSFVFYASNLNESIRWLAGFLDSHEDAQASSRRIVGVMANPETLPDAENPIELTDIEGSVEYDDVSFEYEGTDEWAIRDVSFRVAPGETIGLVGPTGAGKSTLVKLLFRFYDVDSGRIRVDGNDIRDVDVRSLRQQIGYVSQEPFLFNGTVRENIAYGISETDRDMVSQAAKMAGADEFISDLSDGYDTIVGERGVKLSGGQRQRIAIARAILRDPAILVLDEATSHVDNETEVLIKKNLEGLTKNRTTFVIAHHLSTVRNADRILVIDEGELIESGTHQELVDKNDLYANLWQVHIGEVEAVSQEFSQEILERQTEDSQ